MGSDGVSPMSIVLPIYEDVGRGMLEARGEHEFAFPPAAQDAVQVMVGQRLVAMRVDHIEHRAPRINGMAMEAFLTPIVVVKGLGRE